MAFLCSPFFTNVFPSSFRAWPFFMSWSLGAEQEEGAGGRQRDDTGRQSKRGQKDKFWSRSHFKLLLIQIHIYEKDAPYLVIFFSTQPISALLIPGFCVWPMPFCCVGICLASFSRTARGTLGIGGSFSLHNGPSASVSAFVILGNKKRMICCYIATHLIINSITLILQYLISLFT